MSGFNHFAPPSKPSPMQGEGAKAPPSQPSPMNGEGVISPSPLWGGVGEGVKPGEVVKPDEGVLIQ